MGASTPLRVRSEGLVISLESPAATISLTPEEAAEIAAQLLELASTIKGSALIEAGSRRRGRRTFAALAAH